MNTATETAVPFDAEPAAPSALQRVLLTFTSPAKALQNLGSGGSWWLPYVLMLLVSLGFAATVGSRVGWETVARNTMATSPKQQAKIDQLPAAQQQQQFALVAKITRTVTYVASVIAAPIFAAIAAGVLLASLNFGLGGQARFGPLFAVYFFSALPQLLKFLLVILLLFLGTGTESFLQANPLGSNPGYYLQGSGTPAWIVAVLKWFDVFFIWQIVVLSIGCAVVAKVSRGKAAAVVVGWVVLGVVISGVSALLS